MKVTFAPEADCGYIYFTKIDPGGVERTISVTVTNDGTLGIVNLDLDGNDRVLGIELVGVSRITWFPFLQWPRRGSVVATTICAQHRDLRPLKHRLVECAIAFSVRAADPGVVWNARDRASAEGRHRSVRGEEHRTYRLRGRRRRAGHCSPCRPSPGTLRRDRCGRQAATGLERAVHRRSRT